MVPRALHPSSRKTVMPSATILPVLGQTVEHPCFLLFLETRLAGVPPRIHSSAMQFPCAGVTAPSPQAADWGGGLGDVTLQLALLPPWLCRNASAAVSPSLHQPALKRQAGGWNAAAAGRGKKGRRRTTPDLADLSPCTMSPGLTREAAGAGSRHR